MSSTTPDTSDFDRLPPLYGALTGGEWSAMAGIWALLAVSALDADLSLLRQSGSPVAYWQVAILTLIATTPWVAAAPWIFAALDRLPVHRGCRIRNVLLRILLAVVANALHALITGALVSGIGPHLGLSADVVARARELWQQPFGGSMDGFLAVLLSHVVMQRVHRSRHRQRRAAELAESLARARFDALSSQLEPHFLFNTLNAITALVRYEPTVAEAMLVKLSDMLRLTLGGATSRQVTVADEVARLALYVDLQQMRFGPRLTVHWTIPPDVRDARVPAMLLQPLVENALIHGAAGIPGPVTVTIAAERIEAQLRLSVCDSGAGLAPDAVARERTGVGHTRARLATLYGEDFVFELRRATVGSGTCVIVEIPWDSSGDADEWAFERARRSRLVTGVA